MLFENKTKVTQTNLAAEQDEIRRLPQFFRASPEYVHRMGGPLYRQILDVSPIGIGSGRYVSIDSRVHMLMPGFLPCIGGWHCDDFYRPTGEQPDLLGLSKRQEMQATHHAILLGADIAPTIFADEGFHIPDATLECGTKPLYRACHNIIEALRVEAGQAPKLFLAPPGKFITFNSLVFHRGSRSIGTGWHLFVRITESDHYEPMNEIRTQTQVYILEEAAGW